MSLDSELQQLGCPALVVTGTNGKSTTANLVERILVHNHRRTVICGQPEFPLKAVLAQSGELDFMTLQLDSFQIENTKSIRPAVAVLLNLSPAYLEHYGALDHYIRAYAPLFANQEFFDWAIVQSQALVRLRQLGFTIPAKTITFSATDPDADLTLDRGLIVSHLSNWAGPLLDLDNCLLRGPHNAENLQAALAVGHVLRLPLEGMVDVLKTSHAGPHRCELVAEINGVQFINDSKAANVDAMEKALRAMRPGENGVPNVWLIAGGTDLEQDFHSAGPLISKRVKGAFLLGAAGQKIRSAWTLFTPCMLVASLLEAIVEAARNATSGDVVLLSPACSGLDQFRNYQHRGQVFCEAVKSIGSGPLATGPHIFGVPAAASC
jgi:UDP-N-acetylmuramoylalanine--D-glutamate ligase